MMDADDILEGPINKIDAAVNNNYIFKAKWERINNIFLKRNHKEYLDDLPLSELRKLVIDGNMLVREMYEKEAETKSDSFGGVF